MRSFFWSVGETTTERHATIKLPNGSYTTANFIGPGTHLYSKIIQGVEPLTAADRAARAHDIRYALATSNEDVRQADLKMLEALQMIRTKNIDDEYNIYSAEMVIRLKVMTDSFAETVTGHIDPKAKVWDNFKKWVIGDKWTTAIDSVQKLANSTRHGNLGEGITTFATDILPKLTMLMVESKLAVLAAANPHLALAASAFKAAQVIKDWTDVLLGSYLKATESIETADKPDPDMRERLTALLEKEALEGY
jgi:hypothetical protein